MVLFFTFRSTMAYFSSDRACRNGASLENEKIEPGHDRYFIYLSRFIFLPCLTVGPNVFRDRLLSDLKFTCLWLHTLCASKQELFVSFNSTGTLHL